MGEFQERLFQLDNIAIIMINKWFIFVFFWINTFIVVVPNVKNCFIILFYEKYFKKFLETCIPTI